MAQSELYKKGEAIRRQLRGDADYERNKREYDADPAMKKFIDVATETVFGALWARPGLDLKTRTLICVVSDAATGRHPELDIHLRFALKEGWTEDELTEVLLHLSGYVGVPLIREAMLVAKDVFVDIRAKSKDLNIAPYQRLSCVLWHLPWHANVIALRHLRQCAPCPLLASAGRAPYKACAPVQVAVPLGHGMCK